MNHTAEIPPLLLADVQDGTGSSWVRLTAHLDGRDRRFTVRLLGSYVEDIQADDGNRTWIAHEIDPVTRNVCIQRANEELVRHRAHGRRAFGAKSGR